MNIGTLISAILGILKRATPAASPPVATLQAPLATIPAIKKTPNQRLLDVMLDDVGKVAEISGKATHPRIADAYRLVGLAGADDSAVPWCAAYMNLACRDAGLPLTGSAAAQSFLKWGEAVLAADMLPGDILVYERGAVGSGQGHVCVLKSRFYPQMIEVVGGNQSGHNGPDAVTIANRSLDRLLGVRRAPAAKVQAAPPISVTPSKGVLPPLSSEAAHWAQIYDRMQPGVPAPGSPLSAAQLESELKTIVSKIVFNIAKYRAVEAETGVPWWFVAAIHNMESDISFSSHLHNGDPLSGRTVNVPAGRPKEGNPPFTWQQSAVDALKQKGLHNRADWRIPTALSIAASYNGTGYASRGVISPYVVAGSDQERPGRFVRDHVFDPGAWSKQIGVGTLIKYMINRGVMKV